MKHNLSFENLWFRAGLFNFGSNYHVGLRAERNHKNQFMLSYRFVHNQKCFSVGSAGSVNHHGDVGKFENALIYNLKKSQIAIAHSKAGANQTVKVGV